MVEILSKVIVADDHPLFRGALGQTLKNIYSGVSIMEAGSLEEVVSGLEGDGPDLVLLDLSMPGMRGFSGLMFIRAQFPGVPVIVVSGSEETATIRRSMEFGSSGFIPKSLGTDAIAEAIDVVLRGGSWTPPDYDPAADDVDGISELVARLSTLTPQQVRVLMMLSEGLLNKQIAYELGVSEATIKAHVSAILQKLNVDSRTQAVIAAAKIEAGQWQSIVT